MKLQQILTLSTAVLQLDPSQPTDTTKSLFILGDSYSATGFNTSSAQPSLNSPMGNPELGRGTTTNGLNWIEYAITKLNHSIILTYDLAYYGSTVNNSIMYGAPRDMITQVEDFKLHYCGDEESARRNANALFVLWFGINDIFGIYLLPNPTEHIKLILQSYSTLLRTLHTCGARKSLIINSPPTTRAPQLLEETAEHRARHAGVTREFNERLMRNVEVWNGTGEFKDATFELHDSYTSIDGLLDRYAEYGFKDNMCIGGEECMWWDEFHPSSKVHGLFAGDLSGRVNRMIGE